MKLTTQDIQRIAKLARIDISQDDPTQIGNDLSGIFNWIEQLSQVNVTGVVPFPEITTSLLLERQDHVTDGDQVADVLKNAPHSAFEMFSVPKVIE